MNYAMTMGSELKAFAENWNSAWYKRILTNQ